MNTNQQSLFRPYVDDEIRQSNRKIKETESDDDRIQSVEFTIHQQSTNVFDMHTMPKIQVSKLATNLKLKS